MKVIYHDKNGRHLAIIAASMHLQTLEPGFSAQDLTRIPYFLHEKERGTLLYMGLDALGNEVYVLGRGKAFRVIRNAIPGINGAFQLKQDLVFADVSQLENWRLKIYDLVNALPLKKKHLVNLIYSGIERSTPAIKTLVKEVHEKIRHREGLT